MNRCFNVRSRLFQISSLWQFVLCCPKNETWMLWLLSLLEDCKLNHLWGSLTIGHCIINCLCWWQPLCLVELQSNVDKFNMIVLLMVHLHVGLQETFCFSGPSHLTSTAEEPRWRHVLVFCWINKFKLIIDCLSLIGCDERQVTCWPEFLYLFLSF